MRDMPEILFRGKRLDGIWQTGYYFAKPILNRAFILLGEEQWEVDPDTVGQYTGLTDKNGVKIFKGDILGSRYDDDHPDDVAIETVVWWGNGWCIEEGSGPDQLTEDGFLPCSEVIGNIHDNLALLEGGGEK